MQDSSRFCLPTITLSWFFYCMLPSHVNTLALGLKTIQFFIRYRYKRELSQRRELFCEAWRHTVPRHLQSIDTGPTLKTLSKMSTRRQDFKTFVSILKSAFVREWMCSRFVTVSSKGDDCNIFLKNIQSSKIRCGYFLYFLSYINKLYIYLVVLFK